MKVTLNPAANVDAALLEGGVSIGPGDIGEASKTLVKRFVRNGVPVLIPAPQATTEPEPDNGNDGTQSQEDN